MSAARVIFVCKGNSARSQMAEAFLRLYGNGMFEVYSAGLEPKGINPFAKRAMEEIGISMEGQYSKDVREFMGKKYFAYMIVLDLAAERKMPKAMLGVGQRLLWHVEDPAGYIGTTEDTLQMFRHIRDKICYLVHSFAEEKKAAMAAAPSAPVFYPHDVQCRLA